MPANTIISIFETLIASVTDSTISQDGYGE